MAFFEIETVTGYKKAGAWVSGQQRLGNMPASSILRPHRPNGEQLGD